MGYLQSGSLILTAENKNLPIVKYCARLFCRSAQSLDLSCTSRGNKTLRRARCQGPRYWSQQLIDPEWMRPRLIHLLVNNNITILNLLFTSTLLREYDLINFTNIFNRRMEYYVHQGVSEGLYFLLVTEATPSPSPQTLQCKPTARQQRHRPISSHFPVPCPAHPSVCILATIPKREFSSPATVH